MQCKYLSICFEEQLERKFILKVIHFILLEEIEPEQPRGPPGSQSPGTLGGDWKDLPSGQVGLKRMYQP